MKVLSFLICVAFTAGLHAGQDPDLTQADLEKYAVFRNHSVESPGGAGVDNYVLRGLDGKEVRDVAKFRFGAANTGGRLTYVLVPAGKHDVTLRYHRVKKRILGSDSYDAEATFGVDLRPGLYVLNGERDNDFVYIWATRDDSGEIVAPRTKCLVRESHGADTVIVPIPIK